MSSPKGKLIVIDGPDGAGKKTQTQLLRERLVQEGLSVESFTFPQYDRPSSFLVREYLNGRYGRPHEINPYVASSFYAIDRLDLSPKIRTLLRDGTHIVTDRYVTANAGHQGGKIKNPEERRKFLEWLHELEYEIMGIPRPDLVLILHTPLEIARQLKATQTANTERGYVEGGKKLDGHESDSEHLQAAEDSYLWLAEQYPQDHRLIACAEAGELLSPEDIHKKIWEALRQLLIK